MTVAELIATLQQYNPEYEVLLDTYDVDYDCDFEGNTITDYLPVLIAPSVKKDADTIIIY